MVSRSHLTSLTRCLMNSSYLSNPQTSQGRPTPCFCSRAIIAAMITKLAHVSILVSDLDEALDWYTNVLGLEKREDNSSVVAGFRWLTVAPKGQADLEIVLFLPGPFQAEEDRKILLTASVKAQCGCSTPTIVPGNTRDYQG